MITQSDWTTVSYLFLVVSGIIALLGSLIVYFNRKSKTKKRRNK